VTKVRLQRARIGALVRQDKASRMAQHVRMHLEADPSLDARALDQLGQTSDGPVPPLARRMWRVALSNSTSDHCSSQSSLARKPCRKPIRIMVPVPGTMTVALGSCDQLLDFAFGQMLTRSQLAIRTPRWHALGARRRDRKTLSNRHLHQPGRSSLTQAIPLVTIRFCPWALESAAPSR
jgi:hypothetical protein